MTDLSKQTQPTRGLGAGGARRCLQAAFVPLRSASPLFSLQRLVTKLLSLFKPPKSAFSALRHCWDTCERRFPPPGDVAQRTFRTVGSLRSSIGGHRGGAGDRAWPEQDRTRQDKNCVDEEVQLGGRPPSAAGGTGERIAMPPPKVGSNLCVCVCVCMRACVMAMHIPLLAALKCTHPGGSALRALLLLGLKFVLL